MRGAFWRRAQGAGRRGQGAGRGACARVRVIARNALVARCSGLWRILVRRPTDNSTDPPKRLKRAYRALKKNQKILRKRVDKWALWV